MHINSVSIYYNCQYKPALSNIAKYKHKVLQPDVLHAKLLPVRNGTKMGAQEHNIPAFHCRTMTFLPFSRHGPNDLRPGQNPWWFWSPDQNLQLEFRSGGIIITQTKLCHKPRSSVAVVNTYTSKATRCANDVAELDNFYSALRQALSEVIRYLLVTSKQKWELDCRAVRPALARINDGGKTAAARHL